MGELVPPPTKWTISRRSPSFKVICGQRSRGAISRLSSTATRSDFMPRDSISVASVNPGATSGKGRMSPLMQRFIDARFRCVRETSRWLGVVSPVLCLHIRPQDSVDARLITRTTLLEPAHHVVIDPDRETVLGFGHD